MIPKELFKTTVLFAANLNSRKRIRINQGGTSSGKTYAIMQVLFVLGMKEPGSVITVVGQDIPNLKRGAFRDAQKIYRESEDLQMWYREVRGDRIYICRNGSVIEFTSYQDVQDAKSGKRQYLFVNEADGIPYAIFDMLDSKTYKGVFIDYNPTTRFWAHDKLINTLQAELIISDHRHNTFLSQETHDRIESMPDPQSFRVYARGKTGKLEGLIYPDYNIIDELPNEFKKRYYGLDFGYTNDESALIFVGLSGGELFLDEIYYNTGMLSSNHAEAMKNAGLSRKDIIIADSARMDTIDEIRVRGFNVLPAKKGPNTIIPGIDIVKTYKINVTRRSYNLINELKNYRWVKDKNDNYKNVPIDLYNHALDAVRYVVFTALTSRNNREQQQRKIITSKIPTNR